MNRFLPISFLLLLIILSGCRQDMFDQPRLNPLRASDFFPDGQSARPIPAHTVARGHLDDNDAFFTGKIGTNEITQLPLPLTRDLLNRGRERFEIYCAVCHGLTGDGDGIVVQRGFPAPPSYHLDRLREAPIGHFYDVITHGYGVMYSYAARVQPSDRWAIAAYIRVLQLSQHASLQALSSSDQSQLQKSQP